MKRLLLLAAAIAVVTFVTETQVSAQGYLNGYEFGTGIAASDFYRRPNRPVFGGYGFGAFRNFDRVRTVVRDESQPYFAVNPPIYYSHPVKRPYGISPFPAPSGIVPVEMSYPIPMPVSQKNPFYNPEVEPVSDEVAPAEPKSDNKVTWIENPHFDPTTNWALTSR